jgi:hypothetical protein
MVLTPHRIAAIQRARVAVVHENARGVRFAATSDATLYAVARIAIRAADIGRHTCDTRALRFAGTANDEVFIELAIAIVVETIAGLIVARGDPELYEIAVLCHLTIGASRLSIDRTHSGATFDSGAYISFVADAVTVTVSSIAVRVVACRGIRRAGVDERTAAAVGLAERHAIALAAQCCLCGKPLVESAVAVFVLAVANRVETPRLERCATANNLSARAAGCPEARACTDAAGHELRHVPLIGCAIAVVIDSVARFDARRAWLTLAHDLAADTPSYDRRATD